VIKNAECLWVSDIKGQSTELSLNSQLVSFDGRLLPIEETETVSAYQEEPKRSIRTKQ
jgi:hypothetical protein